MDEKIKTSRDFDGGDLVEAESETCSVTSDGQFFHRRVKMT